MTIERFKRKRGPQSSNAVKHGVWVNRYTPEEEREREDFEAALVEHCGGHPSTAEKVLIRRAGFIEIRLRRSERATADGHVLPDAWVLSWINAQRILLQALGLQRRKKADVADLQSYLRRVKRA